MLPKTPGQLALIYQHSTGFLGCQPTSLPISNPFAPERIRWFFEKPAKLEDVSTWQSTKHPANGRL